MKKPFTKGQPVWIDAPAITAVRRGQSVPAIIVRPGASASVVWEEEPGNMTSAEAIKLGVGQIIVNSVLRPRE